MNRKRNLIIAVAVAIGLSLIIGSVAGGAGVFRSHNANVTDKTNEGDRYLSELKFTEAIASFQDALKIDPKNEEAMEKLADAYISLADAEINFEAAQADPMKFSEAEYIAVIEELQQGLHFIEDNSQYKDNPKAEESRERLKAAIKQYETARDVAEAAVKSDAESTGEAEVEAAGEAEEAPEEESPNEYDAYKQLVQDIVNAYGQPGTAGRPYDGMYRYMTGLSFAYLTDFDGDGVEELLICYNNGDGVNTYAVYAYIGDELRPLYSELLPAGHQELDSYVRLSELDGRVYLHLSDLFFAVELWTKEGDSFRNVQTYEADPDSYQMDEDYSRYMSNTLVDYNLGLITENPEFEHETKESDVMETINATVKSLNERSTSEWKIELTGAPTQTSEPQAESDSDNYLGYSTDELIEIVIDRMNRRYPTDGNYVVLDDLVTMGQPEAYISGDTFYVTVRYQMSEEEANERIRRGAVVQANVIVDDLQINLRTGEVTSSSGERWNLSD